MVGPLDILFVVAVCRGRLRTRLLLWRLPRGARHHPPEGPLGTQHQAGGVPEVRHARAAGARAQEPEPDALGRLDLCRVRLRTRQVGRTRGRSSLFPPNGRPRWTIGPPPTIESRGRAPTSSEKGTPVNDLITRRDLLARSGMGMASLGLAGLVGEAVRRRRPRANPLAPRAPHFPAKAKRVIHLFMNGGPSHVDTFDPKPLLDKHHGKPVPQQPPHRAQDRRRLPLAVQVRQVRQVRHRGQRDLPETSPSTSTTSASSARCTPTCRTTSRRCCS